MKNFRKVYNEEILPSREEAEESVTVPKENIVEIQPEQEERVLPKKLEPKYDYTEPYSFKEKDIKDGGKF